LSRGARAAYARAIAAALSLILAGCFNPDLSSDIPCASGEESCPRSMECIDGYCRADGARERDADGIADADDIPDADDTPDASSDRDARSSADAALATPCDPLISEDCGSGVTNRCAFIATSSGPPYDGYFGCVAPLGNQQIGDPCDYLLPGGEGFYDDCRTGLLCGAGRSCQRICELGQDESCNSDPALCEPPDVIEPDVSPLGLCDLGP
jgi:hypothetical protein